MMPKNMTTAELERVYDLMAEGVDRAGADQAPLFLAKLAFALANRLGDGAAVERAIEAALRDLEGPGE